MPKFIRITFAVLLSLFYFQLLATHNRSGYITYKRIPPYTGFGNAPVYNYSITVIKYFNDDGGNFVADRCVDTVYFGDGTRGIALRVNGSVNCNCGAMSSIAATCGSLISNQVDFVVKENIYSIIHTYPGPGSYLLESSDPNRSAGISNIPLSDQIGFYLHSFLVISNNSQSSSSPVLTNLAVARANVNNCMFHNLGAVDADGDSLSYELVDCAGMYGQPISGFTQPGFGVANSVFLVDGNGILTWCDPQFVDEFSTAIKIKEFRKNSNGAYVLIGYVVVDMQILVSAYWPLSVDESHSDERLLLYPNPFTSELSVLGFNQQNDQVELLLYSTEGKLVMKQNVTISDQQIHLNLKQLEPGLYLIDLRTSSGRFVRKIVKY